MNGTATNPWIYYAVGSACFAALTAIFGKLGVAEINSNMATFIRTLVILALTALFITLRQQWEPLGKISHYGMAMLVISGIATGLSWLCYYRALQLAPASRVAPVDKLSVVLVIVMGVLFLHEAWTWKLLAGAALITAGTLLVAF